MIYRYNITTPNGEYAFEADHDLTMEEWDQYFIDQKDPNPQWKDIRCEIIEER